MQNSEDAAASSTRSKLLTLLFLRKKARRENRGSYSDRWQGGGKNQARDKMIRARTRAEPPSGSIQTSTGRQSKRIHWHNAPCQFSRAIGTDTARMDTRDTIETVHSAGRDWISLGFKTHRGLANPLIYPRQAAPRSLQNRKPRFRLVNPLHTEHPESPTFPCISCNFQATCSEYEFVGSDRGWFNRWCIETALTRGYSAGT